MKQSTLFCPRNRGGVVFIGPDYNTSMEEQREMTMKRLEYLKDNGAFDGWFAKEGYEGELWQLAMAECISFFDHSLAIKLGVHFVLWYGFGLSIFIVCVRMIFLATISSYLYHPALNLGLIRILLSQLNGASMKIRLVTKFYCIFLHEVLTDNILTTRKKPFNDFFSDVFYDCDF